MAHQRQLIREAVKAQLLGVTGAGSRVYETRMVPWHRLELPAVAVYTLEESVTDNASAPRELQRDMQLAIEAVVQHSPSTNTDDAMDNIAHQIEVAMHSDWTLGDTASNSMLASCEMDILESGQKEMGLVRLVYSVRYYTYAPESADVTLVPLDTIDAKYDLGDAQAPADQAEDTLNF